MIGDMVDLGDFERDEWSALRAALENGDYEQLLSILESDRDLGPKFAAAVQALMRDLIRARRVTRPKRGRGRPQRKKLATEMSERKIDRRLKKPKLFQAVRDVPRLMRVWRARYKKKGPLQKAAINKAAERRGANAGQIVDQLRLSRSDPRKL
jgi:hypothetical protein